MSIPLELYNLIGNMRPTVASFSGLFSEFLITYNLI